jgi:hypothetical protein
MSSAVLQASDIGLRLDKAAIKTFSKNGFEICGTDPNSLCLGDKTYDELLMVKRFRYERLGER